MAERENTATDVSKPNGWGTTDLSARAYAVGEQYFHTVATQVRDELLATVVKPASTHKIVEIGSGLGRAFTDSRFRAGIDQTDPNPDVVASRRKRGDPVACVDATALSSYASNLDVVLANNVLDTLNKADMTKCLTGIRAALRPAGKFIHFMDLNAHHRPLCEDLLSQGLLPFPWIVAGTPHILPIPAETVARRLDEADLSDLDLQQIQWFVDDPLAAYRVFMNPNGGTFFLSMLAAAVSELCEALNLSVTPVTYNDQFLQSCLEVLSGFQVVSSGYHRRTVDIAATDSQRNLDKNYFVSSQGLMRSYSDPSVPKEHLRICVDVHALVLVKK